jgi:hypothetical protein
MRTLVSASLFASLLLSAAVASADTSTSASAAAPGATADSNVNTLDGQLVPVGEKNEYRLDYKRVNISSNPVGWMAGFYGVSASYALTDHLAIKADGNIYHHLMGSDENGTEFSATAMLFLRRSYQGAYVEPGVMTRKMDGADHTTAGPEMLIGWQKSWDSGFNVAAAVGLGRDLNAADGDAGIFGNGYFRVGYEF